MRELVAVKVLKPVGTIAMALVGFLWPEGNKAFFITPMKKSTRKQVLWGKPTGKEVRKSDDYMRQAFDETRPAQIAAFENGVTKAVERKLRDLGRG